MSIKALLAQAVSEGVDYGLAECRGKPDSAHAILVEAVMHAIADAYEGETLIDHTCPDCNGEGLLTNWTAGGDRYLTTCPRCDGGGLSR